jgi:hypothetical protein
MRLARVGYLKKRSLQRLLRQTFEIQEENKERERSNKAIRAILDALVKYPTEPATHVTSIVPVNSESVDCPVRVDVGLRREAPPVDFPCSWNSQVFELPRSLDRCEE